MRAVLSRLKTKRALIQTVIVLLIIIALFIIYKIYSPKPKVAYVTPQPSNAAVANGFSNSAQQLLASKDYQGAANAYVIEASSLIADHKYDAAKNVLIDATNKIPQDQIPWNVYDTLYAVARAQDNKTLEKSSLEKAIEKVKQDPSQQGMVNIYQQELDKLH